MRVLFALAVAVAFLRVVWPLPEGAANCPVMGNWSDSEGTKTLRVWRSAQQINTSVLNQGNSSASNQSSTSMFGFGNFSLFNPSNTAGPNSLKPNMTTNLQLNMSDYRFVHESTNDSKPLTIFNSTAFLVVLANVSGPNGYSSTNKTIMELLCSNDILFVEIIPPAGMALEETSFSLRRRAAPPLSEAPPEPPIASSPSPPPPLSPSQTPQFILVNITLPPNRQDDDSQRYEEKVNQDNESAVWKDSASEEDEAMQDDVCCAGRPSCNSKGAA